MRPTTRPIRVTRRSMVVVRPGVGEISWASFANPDPPTWYSPRSTKTGYLLGAIDPKVTKPWSSVSPIRSPTRTSALATPACDSPSYTRPTTRPVLRERPIGSRNGTLYDRRATDATGRPGPLLATRTSSCKRRPPDSVSAAFPSIEAVAPGIIQLESGRTWKRELGAAFAEAPSVREWIWREAVAPAETAVCAFGAKMRWPVERSTKPLTVMEEESRRAVWTRVTLKGRGMSSAFLVNVPCSTDPANINLPNDLAILTQPEFSVPLVFGSPSVGVVGA